MKKSERQLLNAALDKALEPSPKRKPALATNLSDYDDEPITAVPQYRSTAPDEQSTQLTPVDAPQADTTITGVPEYRSTAPVAAVPTERYYRKANELADEVDRTLTPAESKVFEHLLRLSLGFQRDTCQVRISVLMQRTGYTSDKTVRAAIKGLELKGRIRRLSTRNNPLGDEYQMLAYSGNTAVPEYRSTPVENTAVLLPKVTGQLKTVLKDKEFDDEAFADFIALFKQTSIELTGKSPASAERNRWRELAELLVGELKMAAARTGQVSSLPAFLTEHLCRRLAAPDAPASKRREAPPAAPVMPPVPPIEATAEERAEYERIRTELNQGGEA
jgi:DNA-binding HxlR family transcriptional regulator